jgi:4-carboxymuconolactone decarboxylase
MTINEKDLYENIVGHVPPEISERIKVGLKTDPELTKMFEDLRIHIMDSKVHDAKTVQLLLFGMMSARLISAPIRYHAVAAKMAGASMDELNAVAGLSLLAGGMRSYNEAGAAIAAAFDPHATEKE